MKWVLIYLALINLLTFICFIIDKRKAIKKTSRISEKSLLQLCFLGGWWGAWMAMIIAHHKISKPAFIRKIIGIMSLHGLIVLGLFLYLQLYA